MAGRRKRDFASLLDGKVKAAVRSMTIDRVSMKVGESFKVVLPGSNGAPIATLSSGDPSSVSVVNTGGANWTVTALAPVSQVGIHMQRSYFGGGAFGVSVLIQVVP